MNIKLLVLTVLFICYYDTNVIGAKIPYIPFTKSTAEDAVAKVYKKNNWIARDRSWLLRAVLWSPLTHVKNEDGSPRSFFREPMIGQVLNIGLGGGRDEWSWYVTFVRKRLAKDRIPDLDYIMTFQVRENGDVNLLVPSR